jgi:branched-chain amino acid transport system permease protein
MERWSHQKSVLAAALLTVLLFYPVVFTGSFAQHIMIMVFMYAGLSLAWDILGGHASLFSFGQAAFFGVGAYTSTMLYLKAGVTPWLGIFAGGGMAVILGLIIGFPTSKLRGHYFAIASLALLVVMEGFFTNWAFIGGAQGISIPVVEQRAWWHMQFNESKTGYYFIFLAALTLTVVVTRLVTRSWIGFYLRALREAPEVAASLGASNVRYRLIAIALSAYFTGLMGSLYAQYVLYIDPSSVMNLQFSVRIVLIAVFGGSGTLCGPLLGAVILVPVMELTRVWLGGLGYGLDGMLLGLLIIILCIQQPDGVIRLLADLAERLPRGRQKGSVAHGAP